MGGSRLVFTALVAQLDRASRYGREGLGFESLRARNLKSRLPLDNRGRQHIRPTSSRDFRSTTVDANTSAPPQLETSARQPWTPTHPPHRAVLCSVECQVGTSAFTETPSMRWIAPAGGRRPGTSVLPGSVSSGCATPISDRCQGASSSCRRTGALRMRWRCEGPMGALRPRRKTVLR